MAGPAPRGTTTLTVAASGTTFERAHSATAGGYASATAEIWTTVEQFVLIHERLERRSLPRLEFERSFSSAPTPIFNLTNWVLGYQIAHIRNATAATVLVMPITPLRYYRWWISSGQSAGCSGGFGGLGGAVSNFAFDMNPVFFSFT